MALRTRRPDAHDVALSLLSVGSGSTDVLSFVLLAGVFTSAMTGNTALLGLALGHGQLATAARAVDALVAFLCGVGAGTLLQERTVQERALMTVLAAETLCLGLFATVFDVVEQPLHGPVMYPLIFIMATAMGLQSIAARIFNLPGIPTVVFTSTLTSIGRALTLAVVRRQPISFDTLRQVAVFISYFGGALFAGALASAHPKIVVALPFALVLCTLVVIGRRASAAFALRAVTRHAAAGQGLGRTSAAAGNVMDTTNCIFCKIVRGEIPAQIYEQTETAIVVPDIEPAAPAHYLVIPKRHVPNLSTFAQEQPPAELGSLLALAAETGRKASPSGFRVITNEGPDAGQLVFHLHFHVLAGRPLGWPPG